MTKAVRSVARQMHHLPWVLAGIVLVAGLANWALFARHQDKPAVEPEPEKPAGVFMSEGAFRQAINPTDAPVEPFIKPGDDPFSQGDANQ